MINVKTKVQSFLQLCLYNLQLMKMKPFQTNPNCHQLKYIVFKKQNNTIFKMNGLNFVSFSEDLNFIHISYTPLPLKHGQILGCYFWPSADLLRENSLMFFSPLFFFSKFQGHKLGVRYSMRVANNRDLVFVQFLAPFQD